MSAHKKEAKLITRLSRARAEREQKITVFLDVLLRMNSKLLIILEMNGIAIKTV